MEAVLSSLGQNPERLHHVIAAGLLLTLPLQSLGSGQLLGGLAFACSDDLAAGFVGGSEVVPEGLPIDFGQTKHRGDSAPQTAQIGL